MDMLNLTRSVSFCPYSTQVVKSFFSFLRFKEGGFRDLLREAGLSLTMNKASGGTATSSLNFLIENMSA
jgi:hypothetical protein